MDSRAEAEEVITALLSKWGETLIFRGLKQRKSLNFPKVTEERYSRFQVSGVHSLCPG